jgi:hypothetical protein
MALNRVPAGERDWAARIEARRRALSSGEAIAQPFQPGLPETVSRASWSVSVPFLMRLLRELAPQLPLELGTGLRVSTAIRDLPRINGAGRLITLDGSAEWVAVAEEGVSSLGLERVEFSRTPRRHAPERSEALGAGGLCLRRRRAHGGGNRRLLREHRSAYVPAGGDGLR